MECFHCKKEVEMKIVEETFSNGTVHNAQYCPLCGGHNKYARRLANDCVEMFVGKYKGEMLTEIPSDYMKWAIEKGAFSNGIRNRFREILYSRGEKQFLTEGVKCKN